MKGEGEGSHSGRELGCLRDGEDGEDEEGGADVEVNGNVLGKLRFQVALRITVRAHRNLSSFLYNGSNIRYIRECTKVNY